MNKIEITLAEAREVFDLLERLNCFFHQPSNYDNLEDIEKFADESYPQIHRLYYDVVWNWLPEEVQKEVEER